MKFVVVRKSGSLVCMEKNFDFDELYKRCGFIKRGGFKEQYVWHLSGISIHLYGRTNGYAGDRNLYSFPPPIRDSYYFGNMALVAFVDGKWVDFDKEQWDQFCDSFPKLCYCRCPYCDCDCRWCDCNCRSCECNCHLE